METLKVTTLTLLIAFVWPTSEVAAYPQPIEEIDAAQNCRPSWTGYPAVKERLGNPSGLSDTTARLIAPPNTSSHQEDREARSDTCSFDFDPNETNSIEVAR